MCEIEGVDVGGSTLTRAAFFPSILVPSRLGPLSAAPSTLTSECRCGLLWLASPPSILTSLPFLLSSLTDLPSRLRLPPGSPAFSFLNGFEKDFRISMRELYRCRSWRVTEIVVAVQLSVSAGRTRERSHTFPARAPESPPTFRTATMSAAIDGEEFSISQLLCATKRKLQVAAFGGWFVCGS